jgi:lysophospholipase L1-like esterase
MRSSLSLLSLGDSYTIGEAVPIHDSFPYQAVQLLRRQGHAFQAPEILAKTGWTTDELEDALKNYRLLPRYDFVTLLIGVNNQYRGREAMPYKAELEALLRRAIECAGGDPRRVVILSIPDYSVTPFAASMEKERIAKEIDIFNTVKRALAAQFNVHFLDITEGSREAATDPSLVAGDGLHPSAKEYGKWAKGLSELIAGAL